MTLILVVLAPWIVRVAFAFGQRAMDASDIELLSSILTWMAPLVGGATLSAYTVRVAMALSLRKRFFVQHLVVLVITAIAAFFFVQGEHKIQALALVASLVSGVASCVFFLSLTPEAWQRTLQDLRKPLLGLVLIAAMGVSVRVYEVDLIVVEDPLLDALALALVGALLLVSYLIVVWGHSLRPKQKLPKLVQENETQ